MNKKLPIGIDGFEKIRKKFYFEKEQKKSFETLKEIITKDHYCPIRTWIKFLKYLVMQVNMRL